MLRERGGDIELEAPRGIDFYASIPVFLFFGVLTVVLVVKGLRGEVKPREAAVYGVGLGSFAALGLAVLIYYRNERRFVMDSAGVRMSRGRRVQRNLAWGEITEIRFGTREVMVSRFSARSLPFFQVRTSRLWRRIYFDGRSYRVPDLEVAMFAEKVAQTATMRRIRVLGEHVKGGYFP